MPQYLNLPPSFCQLPVFNHLNQTLQLPLSLQKTQVTIDVKEFDVNGFLSPTPYLEGRLKSILGDFNFIFSDDTKKCKYKISIQSRPVIQQNQDFLFAYITADLTITNIKTNEEIFKNAYNNVKAGGLDPTRAISLATKKLFEQIQDDIAKWLDQ